jgi:mRNA interferase RelE/StbE
VAAYSVNFKASARKELDAIDDGRTRRKVSECIEALAADPRPFGGEKLRGSSNRYRIRQGDYRILYEIREAVKVVAVIHVGHRREVYR